MPVDEQNVSDPFEAAMRMAVMMQGREKVKMEALVMQIAWVDHWLADVKHGLLPTADSLSAARNALIEAMK